MKRLHTAVLGSFLAILTFSACKKDDKPAAKECQVQQFESTRNLNYNGVFGPVPYLFSKTLDANGDVNTIDAYVYSLSGGFRQQGKLERKNQMVYVLNTIATDTIMIIWLNNAGKVIKAQERSGFKSSVNGALITYDFTYNADNKLQQYVVQISGSTPQTSTQVATYDAAGNCLRIGSTYFTYDMTRTAKKQFYFDSESLGTFWLGFKLLEYLNYFPEVTSPVNIRTNTRVEANPTANLINTPLSDHQLDADGKLISYKAGGGSALPIFWSCGNSVK